MTQVLIMKTKHHGDVLLMTPVIAALKRHDPHCEIDVLIDTATRDILAAHPDVRYIECITRKNKNFSGFARLQEICALAHRLRARHYDVVLCLSPPWRNALLAAFSAAPRRITLQHAHHPRLWQLFFTDSVPELDPCWHMVEHDLAVLRPLNLPTLPFLPLRMHYFPQDNEHMQALLRERGWQGENYILIHPGSRWFFKCWSEEKNSTLIQILLDDGYSVVLSAAPDAREAAMLEKILAPLGAQERLYVLSGCLNLRELAALVDHAALLIGVDSLPMHMAAALNTPCVALFGPSWLHRWRPWSAAASVIDAGDYAPLPHPDSIDVNTEKRYLNVIPVQVVYHTALSHLRPLSPAPS